MSKFYLESHQQVASLLEKKCSVI